MSGAKKRERMAILPPRAFHKLIEKSCFVIEVADSINPEGTRSISLFRTVKKMKKPLLLVLNKVDLVPRWVAEAWMNYYRNMGISVVLSSTTMRKGRQEILKSILEISQTCNEEKKIGVICGVPKTGKSSILNMLKGKESAPTSRYPGKPGYTKSFTLYRVAEGVYIYDTPGVFPDARDKLERIIRSNSPEKIIEPVKPSIEIIEMVKLQNPSKIKKLYGVDPQKENYEILEDIAKNRGWLEKLSKEPLVEQAAIRVIMDYLDGKLGIFRLPPKKNSNL